MYLGRWKLHQPDRFVLHGSTAGGSFYRLNQFDGKEEAIARGEVLATKYNREMQVYFGSDQMIARILPGFTLECIYE
jgi:hypothetical protein